MRCDWIAKSNLYLHERWTKWAIMGLWMIDDGFSDSQKKDTSASRFRVKVKTFTSPKIASLFHFLFIISSALSVKARVKVAAQEAERKYKSNAAVCCFFVYSFSSHPKVRSLLSKLIQCISLQWIDENFEIAIETFCTV